VPGVEKLLDQLVRMENEVMEPMRKRSFPGGNLPLDRLSISVMENKQASNKSWLTPIRSIGGLILRLGSWAFLENTTHDVGEAPLPHRLHDLILHPDQLVQKLLHSRHLKHSQGVTWDSWRLTGGVEADLDCGGLDREWWRLNLGLWRLTWGVDLGTVELTLGVWGWTWDCGRPDLGVWRVTWDWWRLDLGVWRLTWWLWRVTWTVEG
ncbi:hypothetical protein CRUP_016415, partial [Coryphaenoides rupestris]